jgi:hypothetical protein
MQNLFLILAVSFQLKFYWGVCVIRWASVAVGRAHWLVCFYDIMSPVVARCMLPSEHSKNCHCLVPSYCMDLF